MPAMSSLRRLLPYYRPYRADVAWGLVLVVASSAGLRVVSWVFESALDGVCAGAPLKSIWALAGTMVGVSLISGAGVYKRRQLMNAYSRWIEYDLRNDLFRALESLDPSYFARMRTGDLMARVTNDLSAVRMAAG